RFAADDIIADTLGATLDSSACPDDTSLGAAHVRAWCTPRRVLTAALSASGPTLIAACRACARASKTPPLCLSLPAAACVFVLRDIVNPPLMYSRESHFPA